jgi:hypothetical protein
MLMKKSADTPGCQASPPVIQEQRRLGRILGTTECLPAEEPAHRHRSDRTKSLAATFPSDPDHDLFLVEVREV